MAASSVTSADASWAPPPQTIIGRRAAPSRSRRRGDRVLVDLGGRRRNRRLRFDRAGLSPHIHGAFDRRRPAAAARHGAKGLGENARRLARRADAPRKADQPLDDAGLIADLVQVAKIAPDMRVGDLADQRQHRRIHRKGGEKRRAAVEKSGTGNDHIGLRRSGGERGAQGHIGRTLLVARVNDPQPVGCAKRGIEQVIVVDAGEGVERVDAVASNDGDGRFGRGVGMHAAGRIRFEDVGRGAAAAGLAPSAVFLHLCLPEK